MTKYLILLISTLHLNAQTQVLNESPFPKTDFVVYASETNFTENTTYEIGRFEPENVAFTPDHLGRLRYNMVQANNPNYFLQIASIFLKINKNNQSFYIELDETNDIDLHRFIISNSTQLIVIAGRYSFQILNAETLSISPKIIPGQGQYQGEDAISPLFDAITFFDNDKFLLGNVQAFGVFCIDIADISNPKELIQHKIYSPENELVYTFFGRIKRNKFDIIVAQNDPNSESTSIRNLYSKLKNISYLAKKTRVPVNHRKQPKIEKIRPQLLEMIQNQFSEN